MNSPLEEVIFKATSKTFDKIALDVFRFQAQENEVYKEYLNLLNVNPRAITNIFEIPFLPISFFKTHHVCVSSVKPL